MPIKGAIFKRFFLAAPIRSSNMVASRPMASSRVTPGSSPWRHNEDFQTFAFASLFDFFKFNWY